MAEKLIEQPLCGNCGADVRINALFCYNCGSQVAPDEYVEADRRGEVVSDAWFRDSITDVKVAESTTVTKKKKKKEIKEEAKLEGIPKPAGLPSDDALSSVSETDKPLKFKTAASLRQKSRLAEKKKVTVKWEKPENSPNLWFVFGTILLLLFALGMLFAMLYIR